MEQKKRGRPCKKEEPTETVEISVSESEVIVYSFQTRARCPRCGGVNTIATSTQGRVQFRRCNNPVCRNRFKAAGVAV